MKYKAVIFDLDGTVLSTLDDLADSVNYALRANGMPQRSTAEVRSFVGNGIRRLIESSVPSGCDAITVDRVLATFSDYYGKHSADKTRPYDGVIEMMTRLKGDGVKIAVLSNKADWAVSELCKRYFGDLVEYSMGETEGIPRKPSPAGVFVMLEKLGVDLDECVYIGDSEVDILTANNAEMDCIAVDWGFRDRCQLVNAGASVIASSPDELYAKLL